MRVIRLNRLANIKLRGPGPPETMLLLGARLNWGPFKYYCRGPIIVMLYNGPGRMPLDQYYC